MRSAILAVVAIAGLVLGACSGSDPAITESASQALLQRVGAAEEMAAGGDPGGAIQQLEGLAVEARALAEAGSIDESALGSIVERVDATITALEATVPPPPTVPSTTAPPTTLEEEPGRGEGRGRGDEGRGPEGAPGRGEGGGPDDDDDEDEEDD